MKIDIWYDFVCPFCYLGETKFEMALKDFEGKETVELNFKSFQLNPSKAQTVDQGKDIHQLIADKYHMSYEQAKANNDRIVASAKEVGLNYRFDILKPCNTEKAHLIAQYAKKVHKDLAFIHRVYAAYFEEGADISDEHTLLKLAQEIGLDSEVIKGQLENREQLEAVHKDQQMAKSMGITGVPFFLINDKHQISGAQSVDHFLKVLRLAANEA
jgi:predicted DsbA family dithiol-disulfide isomerase